MAFGKLFKKLLGRGAGTVVDTIVDGALDKATGGLSTVAEDAVADIKAKKRSRRPRSGE
jgi:hypothetical protein